MDKLEAFLITIFSMISGFLGVGIEVLQQLLSGDRAKNDNKAIIIRLAGK